MPAFYIVALGQLISIFGTNMTQFALTIWSWQFVTEIQPRADPATAMALVGFFNFAPEVLLSPIAGALVDRWNRKLVMMMVDLAAGLATVAVFVLYVSGQLQIWHLYIAGAFTGAFKSFQFPAYSAAISTMIPKAQYARADAVLGLTESIPFILAPVAAAFLLGIIDVSGVMLIDIVTFSAAVGALLFIHIPQPERSAASPGAPDSLLQDSLFGFRYIFQRPSLLGLQMIFFWGNLLFSLGFALIAPMILARTGNDEQVLGYIQSAMGVGAIAGGMVLAAWGGLKRRVHGVLGGWFLASLLGSVLLGVGRGLPVWLVAAVGGNFVTVFINASNQAIWQSKVPPDVQGRVFAARRMIAQVVGPLGILLAGPLADRVFEPAMREGGSLAGTFGGLVGTGPGAGIGLLMVITGGLAALVGLAGYWIPAIRDAESLLPDHDIQSIENPSAVEVSLSATSPS
jgi:MFS family permease